jgi:putative ABC transport system ATP-binding protein
LLYSSRFMCERERSIMLLIMLEINNIRYKGILKTSHFVVGDKPFTLVTGPSGGGKTTFLRLLCNIIPYDEGSIYFNNKNILEIDAIEYRRQVTMLSQTAFIIEKTIEDNISFACLLHNKKTPTKQQLEQALEIVMLEKSVGDEVVTLSGGEQQRLCLARALFLNPQILLLDEPASSLDHNSAVSILDRFITLLNERGTNIIMISHSPDTVLRQAVKIKVTDGFVSKEE